MPVVSETIDQLAGPARPHFIKLDPAEKSRKYIFTNGYELTFNDVRAVAVSERGTHRIEMGDGQKAIVLPGFVAIILDVPEWTF